MKGAMGTPLRLLVLAGVLFGAAAVGTRAMQPEITPPRLPLEQLPRTVAGWAGHDAPAFAPAVLAMLGVDDYVHRVYETAGVPLSLYVGHYRSQREGSTIHSPQNCLPGAGWMPVAASTLTLRVDGRSEPVTVNRLLIQKGADRQVVLYWYQSQGRVVASDYWSKAYLVYDAIRLNRSDAAMVRVISPVLASESSDAAATRRAAEFVDAVFPHLDRALPL